MFRKCSCIVKVSGGRFLTLWRQTLLTDYPHCGVCSARILIEMFPCVSQSLIAEEWCEQKKQSYHIIFHCSLSSFIPRLWK